MNIRRMTIRNLIYWRNRKYAYLGIALMFCYFSSIFFLSPGNTSVNDGLKVPLNCQDSSWNALPTAFFNSEQTCPTIAETIIDIQNIEAGKKSILKANMRIWPAGELGGAAVTTGIAQRSIDVEFENLTETSWYIVAKRLIGGRSIEIPLGSRSQISNYPFDSYQGTWQSELSPSGVYTPFLSTVTVAERDIFGWQIEVNRFAYEGDEKYQKIVNKEGFIGFEWNATRSGIFRVSVIILLLTMMLGVYAAVILTISIIRERRPPTLNALSWLATSLFALVEIRSRFPGDPPYGIKLDTLFTYPVIAILLFLIIIHSYLWVKRDDWNMKNVSSNIQ